MTAYIVRLIASHEVVGVYSAKSLDALRNLVDEVAPCSDCEFSNLKDGGIHFQGGAPKVPFAEWCEDRGDPDPYQPLFSAAYISESWSFEADRRWRPLGPGPLEQLIWGPA